ncbi:hypothetical protein D3C79_739980 [compost metagenome]
MASTRYQLFARPGFALDQHRRLQARHLVQARLELLERRRVAQQRLQPLGMVVQQRRQTLTDTAGWVQG